MLRHHLITVLLLSTALLAQIQHKAQSSECPDKLASLFTGFDVGKLAPAQRIPFGVVHELSQRSEARKFSKELGNGKGWEDKIPDDPSPFEFEVCQGILAGLYPGEKAMFLSNDGSVLASHTGDGLTYLRQFPLPTAARSRAAFVSVGKTVQYAERVAENDEKVQSLP